MFNDEVASVKEYTFPNLTPSSECKNGITKIKEQAKPFRIILAIALIMCIAFFILALVLGLKESSAKSSTGHFDEYFNYVYDYTPNYSTTISCAILAGIAFITAIVMLVMISKYSKLYRYLESSIQINTQYSAFINQGYSTKEAYKLTLEWLDRQATIRAIYDSATAISATIALSQLNRK